MQHDESYFDALLASGNAAVPKPADVLRPPMRDRLLTVAQIRSMPPPEPLVDGLLDLDSLGLLYGARGSFKSFVAIDLGLSVATGRAWHGKQVTPGGVLYVVAEGQAGLSPRFDAWLRASNQSRDPENFYTLPDPVNLLAPMAVTELAELAAELDVKLVMLDTLARCLVGGDENSAKDAGLAVEQMDLIRRRTGACVLLVHHAGKAREAGARGSSAFEAACETVLEVTADNEIVKIATTKQKNHQVHGPILLRAWPENGSVVLGEGRGMEAEKVTDSMRETLAALAAIEVPGGVSSGAWEATAGGSRATFYRNRKGLVDAGEVSATGTGNQARYQVVRQVVSPVSPSLTGVS